MAFTYDPRLVYRDFVTDGVPSSGVHEPSKPEIRSMMAERDAVIEAGIASGSHIYLTRADLFADLAHDANTQAWVVADSTAAYNGIYRKTGISGAGEWTRVADLPYSLIRATNAGGTADDVEATSTLPVPSGAYVALISVNFAAANTGAMTLAINDETPRNLVTNTGDPIPAGYVAAGMSALIQIDENGDYRLFSYGDATAVQAAAEAALSDLLDRYLGAYADDAAATAAAGTPVEGQLYWNTSEPELRVYDGANWVSATQTAATRIVYTATADGTTVEYADLDATADASNSFLFIDGRQIQTGFTLVAGTLTLDEAPASGVPITVITFETTPLGNTTAAQVSITDSGGYFDGGTVEEALEELAINILGGASATIAYPEDYGAVGDGVADDTAAVLAAMQSGKPDMVLRATYLTSLQTWSDAVCPDLRRMFGEGRGTLKQSAEGHNMLRVYQRTRPVIEGIRLEGIYSTGLTDASNLNNRGILLEECDHPIIRDLFATRLKFHPIHVLGGTDIDIDGLEVLECGTGFYSRGGTGACRLRRVKAQTCLFADSVFTIAVSFESTDGHSYGVPQGWSVEDVRVRGFLHAQGVMAHSGVNMKFSKLDIDGSVIGFSLNSASAALGADTLSRITLSDSLIVLPATGPAGYSGGNSCVFVAGDAANGTYATQIGVSNVHCSNGNRAEQHANQGAVQVQDSRDFSWSGGGALSAYGGGFVFNGNNDDFALWGATIRSVIAVSGNQNGVWVRSTGNTGSVGGLTIRDSGTGIRRESGNDVSIDASKYSSVSTPTV